MTPLPTSPRTWFTTYLQGGNYEGEELLQEVEAFLNTPRYDFERSTFLMTTGGAAGIAEIYTKKGNKVLLTFGNGKAWDNVLDIAENVYDIDTEALCTTVF